MSKNQLLAVITARGGSKRIPEKNLRMIGDQSLLERTIRVANASKYIDRVILSSDCPKIISEALDCGCDVPFTRPYQLASDEASSEDVLEHAIHSMPPFEWVLLLQPTSPFRTASHIDVAFELLQQSGKNSLVSVKENNYMCSFSDHHRFYGVVVNPHRNSVQNWQEKNGLRYVLNGAIYLVQVKHFLKTKELVNAETVGVEMSDKTSLDIDTFEDLMLASKLMETDSDVRQG